MHKGVKKFDIFASKTVVGGLLYVVILTPSLLERWYNYRRIYWIKELEYPEFTAEEVGRFLKLQ